MGIQLKQAGIDDFVILEKAATLGGTWRDNTYPGASCDAPSFLYSFSFAQKTDWSRRFAWQPELLAYSTELAIRHGLLPHCRFDAEVTGATLTTSGSQHLDADLRRRLAGRRGFRDRRASASSIGPPIPRPAGSRDRSPGTQFHSAQWNHAVDLTGEARRRDRQRGERRAVRAADRAAGRAADDLPALGQLADAAQGPALRAAHAAPADAVAARSRSSTTTSQWLYFGEMQLTPLMKQVRPVQALARWKSLAHLRRQVQDPALARQARAGLPDRREARAVQRRLLPDARRVRTSGSSPMASNASSRRACARATANCTRPT